MILKTNWLHVAMETDICASRCVRVLSLLRCKIMKELAVLMVFMKVKLSREASVQRVGEATFSIRWL